jgi:hypothetical protein
MQEIVELVVFGLIAVLVGTGVLWLVGWLIGLLGSLFMWLAGLLWLVLKYIVPVFVILGAVYYLFRLLQNRNQGGSAAARDPVVSGPRPGGESAAAAPTPAAAPVTTPQVQGMPYNPDGPAAALDPDAREVRGTTDDPVIVEPEIVEDDSSDDSKKA